MITTNKKNLNIRTISTDHNQLRAAKNNDGTTTISGYAVTFNQPSQPIPFIEYIDDHALDDVDFSKTLLLYGHDFNKILARADSHTLNIKVDQHGLFFTATLADTTLANDVREDIIAGNLKGCSFGFNIAPNGDSWDTDKDGNTIHYVNKISDVAELTITPIPAYTSTSVQVERDLKEYLNNKEEQDLNSEDNSNVVSSSAVASSAASTVESSAASSVTSTSDVDDIVASAVSAALAGIKTAVSAACKPNSTEKRDDGDDSDVDNTEDNTADDSNIEDDSQSNQSSPTSTAASSSSVAASSAVSSNTSSVASSENRSIDINKEENTHKINVTPNSENKKKQQ